MNAFVKDTDSSGKASISRVFVLVRLLCRNK